MGDAFLKDCAPPVPEIGPYSLVGDCDFPPVPEPIVIPDPPIVIPPIDEGCYSLVFTGTFLSPSHPDTPPGGSVGVSLTYPTGDACEPEIDIRLYMPCFVSFGDATGSVIFSPDIETGFISISAIDDGDCDFGISMLIGLPCSTDIIGGDATVEYRAALSATQGSMTVTPSAVPDTCDFLLDFDLLLPCPGALTVSTDMGPSPCVANPPSFAVNVTNILNSSSRATCGFNLEFDLTFPCPITWGDPTDHSLVVTEINAVGPTTGTIFINSGVAEGSCDSDACFPQLLIDLQMPCPADFSGLAGPAAITHDSMGTPLPWAIDPFISFSAGYIGGELCDPFLQIDLNLPCPVNISDDPNASMTAVDENFWTSEPLATSLKTRQWAFGQPSGGLDISLGSNGPDETPCLPSLALNLNFPCPTGGIHGDVTSGANYDESLILATRAAEYTQRYGPDATLHPYWSRLPTSTIRINRDILGLFARGGFDPAITSDIADSIGGLWGKTEFNENCELDLDFSLYMPCGIRSPKIVFHDYADLSLGILAPELTEHDHIVWQDWTQHPSGGNDPDPCAYEEELHLFLSPGSGGGSASRFAEITSSSGGQAPYLYDAHQVEWTTGVGWTALAGGIIWNATLINIAETGPSGSGAKNLLLGDIVMVWKIHDDPPPDGQWIFDRLHFRGVYG